LHLGWVLSYLKEGIGGPWRVLIYQEVMAGVNSVSFIYKVAPVSMWLRRILDHLTLALIDMKKFCIT
jgi:hypothetical protein